jgi:hypothetical protein
MTAKMKRRQFITLLGGAAAAWPLAARAQQGKQMRSIGVLDAVSADDPQSRARDGAFVQGLGELGWRIGRNLQIDYRTGAAQNPGYAAELAALAPEVILAVGSSVVGPLLAATRNSCRSAIQSTLASSQAWRVRAEISPASPISNWRSRENGWRRSRTWRRRRAVSSSSRSPSIQRCPDSCARSRLWSHLPA